MSQNRMTDYRNAHHWMEIPKTIDHPVDIFYLYPTAYFKTGRAPLICDVDHPAMRARATEHLAYKGSAFQTVGNYFVPFYRQACIECLLSDDQTIFGEFIDKTCTDIQNAFTYYMENLNGGRPFILAGHSQGALLGGMLLSTTFRQHPEYLDQMVAAYIIGFGITPEYLTANPHLHFAQGARDTGVIISYNTEAPGVTGQNITLPKGSIAINPITWSRSTDYAPACLSQGSHLVLRDSAGRLLSVTDRPHYADAQIDPDRGVVLCTTADVADFRIVGAEHFFPEGVLHNGDYSLYYYDLRKNAQDRVTAWFEKGGLG